MSDKISKKYEIDKAYDEIHQYNKQIKIIKQYKNND